MWICSSKDTVCFYIFKSIYGISYRLIFVEFFFVLSGFVLYPENLFKVINKKNNLLIFYKRRWMRTLPLYFLILRQSNLRPLCIDIDFFKYFFLIQKSIPNFIENDYYPVAWSLSIEELFYLLFPLVLVFSNSNEFFKNFFINFYFYIFN